MKIIPVIDIRDGLVVHAKQGYRDRYRPIRSELCGSAVIGQVIDALLQVYEFDTFYIADLNALVHEGNHDRQIEELAAAHPEITFWIDRGLRQTDIGGALPLNHVPVVGTESIDDADVSTLANFRNRMILSLDYDASGPLGCLALFDSPDYWPDTVIIMTLAQVGGSNGPNLQLLSRLRKAYPNTRFVAAGGIRHRQDLLALHGIGINEVLIATALHSGAIGKQDIIELNRILDA